MGGGELMEESNTEGKGDSGGGGGETREDMETSMSGDLIDVKFVKVKQWLLF